MSIRSARLLFAGFLAFVACCVTTSPAHADEPDPRVLVLDRFVGALNSGGSDIMASLFTSDTTFYGLTPGLGCETGCRGRSEVVFSTQLLMRDHVQVRLLSWDPVRNNGVRARFRAVSDFIRTAGVEHVEGHLIAAVDDDGLISRLRIVLDHQHPETASFLRWRSTVPERHERDLGASRRLLGMLASLGAGALIGAVARRSVDRSANRSAPAAQGPSLNPTGSAAD